MIGDDFAARLVRGEAFSGVGFSLRILMLSRLNPRKL
jgi:hypothetical protein